MKSIDIDKEMELHRLNRHKSWAKLISKLKKQLDIRMMAVTAERGHENFKLGYMPFLMNIDLEGITTTELSKRFGVTKQATSKIINELVELKYVTVQPHGADKRSTIIFLTERGKKFVIEAKLCTEQVSNEYRKLLGKKEYENMIQMLIKITEYNESQGPIRYL